ncbi:MAG: NifB/NifX family molybdenum-iron cluster-binding protein [Desulfovibrionaceae bacterium]
MDRTSAILARGVKFLVCGAICRCAYQVLRSAGVQVACWRCGEVRDVLQALQDDALDKLAMPGCPGRPCCSPGQGAGWRRGRRAGLARGDFSLLERSSSKGEKK